MTSNASGKIGRIIGAALLGVLLMLAGCAGGNEAMNAIEVTLDKSRCV